jgi:hypothetical protein
MPDIGKDTTFFGKSLREKEKSRHIYGIGFCATKKDIKK